ncbi:hypothetical protein W97_07449 [Coniosporium apollinis CBS 100218]|uniref:Ca2+ regulator and membrane fusion protein Fig1-domain-containing protein n=1 Tax=Coniosporium apollinis (strain CBS 100218) TaxID=1168221 RepID=R7Z1C1_CONA1|nr:uncharacterized protein W97_07449 [Coniosporium apollinis CBS 100218]EON67952.1 hypothetical protein W97_07449 [Coniosporium apollinis CBS 100218]
MATDGKRSLPSVFDWRLGTYFLPVPIILLYVLAMVGGISESPGVVDIFLFKLQSGNGAAAVNAAASELRVGYFGMCAGTKKDLVCLPTSGVSSAEKLAVRFNEDSARSSTGLGGLAPLLPVALSLQSKTFLCVLAVSGVLFCVSLVCLGLLKRDIKKQAGGSGKSHEQRLRRASLALLWVSVALATVSAAAVTQATSALKILTKDLPAVAVSLTAGITLQALQWAVIVLSTLFSLGISILVKGGGGMSLSKLGLPGPGPAAPPMRPTGPPMGRPPGAVLP